MNRLERGVRHVAGLLRAMDRHRRGSISMNQPWLSPDGVVKLKCREIRVMIGGSIATSTGRGRKSPGSRWRRESTCKSVCRCSTLGQSLKRTSTDHPHKDTDKFARQLEPLFQRLNTIVDLEGGRYQTDRQTDIHCGSGSIVPIRSTNEREP